MRDWERASRHGGVGREKGVELQACPLPKPATFLHPESQEMRGGRGACGVEHFQTAAVTQSNMVGKKTSSRVQWSQGPGRRTHGVRAD